MRAPDHDSRQTGRARFERGQISDAAFIGASAIVDHEYVTRLRSLHRFQKDIDASIMPGRKRAARHASAWNHRRDSRRREAQRNLCTVRAKRRSRSR